MAEDTIWVELTIPQIATVLATLDASLVVCRATDNIIALQDAKAALLTQINRVA